MSPSIVTSGPANAASLTASVVNSTTTTSAPKLKSSCDMCASSKVRCESQKPVCGRCAKLGHPCIYSVARRVGRRHGSKRGAPAREHPLSPRLPKHLPAPRTLLERQESPAEPYYSYGPGHGLTQGSGSLIEAGVGLPALSPAETVPGGFLLGTRRGSLTPSTETNSGVGHVRTCSLSSASATDGQSQSPYSQYWVGWAGCGHQKRSSSRLVNHPLQKAHEEGSMDCAAVVLSLQEQLEATCKGLFSSTRSRTELMSSVNAAMDAICSALDRLSTVLICPCSERLDVSLLVGAVCASIIDAYGFVVKLSASLPSNTAAFWSGSKDQVVSGGRTQPTSTIIRRRGFEDDDLQQWEFSNISYESQGGQKRRASMMDLDTDEQIAENPALTRVIDEFPRMASVTLQYTRRSGTTKGSSGGASVSSEVAYAVASYTRTRLQVLKNEVTGHLRHAV